MNKELIKGIDDPDLDGPDYVALVIEWEGPVGALDDQVTMRTAAPNRFHQLVDKLHLQPVLDAASKLPGATIAKALGAIGAVALASWGVHRLRHA